MPLNKMNIKSQIYKLKNNENILIREASPDDAKEILIYVDQISAESDNLTFGPGEFNIALDNEMDLLRKSNESSNDIFFLGYIDNKIVSSISFFGGKRPRIEHVGEFGMAVIKDKWKLGIGSLMVDRLLEWSKESGIIKKINLHVRADNQSAIYLYKKKGFKEVGKLTRAFIIDGEYIDHLCMGYEI